MNIAVIGKNFGDEGKGLAVANLCFHHPNSLVIKHNGGGQAGHTVEIISQKKKFIHHQIGSGAEFGARTFFCNTFHPDLFQLKKEIDEFKSLYGFVPEILAEGDVTVTTIDDVILNMGAEKARGQSRHGSCGMGINECYERELKGFKISLFEIEKQSEDELYKRLSQFRADYSMKRVKEVNISENSEYYELLIDDNVLMNFVKEIKKNVTFIRLVDATKSFLEGFDNLIFESGQGLLLDFDKEEYMPYLTPSKTGLANPLSFLSSKGMILDEAIYVTRSYVTRHGAGPLPCEVSKDELWGVGKDLTNAPNEWQGAIRYAKHESIDKFIEEVLKDIGDNKAKLSILLTHMDETGGLIYFEKESLSVDKLKERLPRRVEKIYCSYSKDCSEIL